MNAPPKIEQPEPFIDDSWSRSVTDDLERSRRIAWIVAAAFGVIALLLVFALVLMLPLKTVEPYALLVDRQTGNVEALDPLTEETISANTAIFPDAICNRTRELCARQFRSGLFEGYADERAGRTTGVYRADERQ